MKRELKARQNKTPAWIERYRKDYEEGIITKEEIFKRENAIREASNIPLLKFKSVRRALTALRGSSPSFREEERERQRHEQKPPEVPSPSPTKPCYGCKYYTSTGICVYPRSMFRIYPELFDFNKDFAEGRCKLKES